MEPDHFVLSFGNGEKLSPPVFWAGHCKDGGGAMP